MAENERELTLGEIIAALPEGHVARRQYKELFEAAQSYLNDTSVSKRARLRRAINIIKGVAWGK